MLSAIRPGRLVGYRDRRAGTAAPDPDDGRLDTATHVNAEAALERWERVYPVKLVWL